MLGLLLTRTLSRIVLVLFLFLETLKEFDKLRVLQWKNMQKVFRISCESKIRENYSVMTPKNYGSFKVGDSTRSRFLIWHAPPCDQRRGVNTPCHTEA